MTTPSDDQLLTMDGWPGGMNNRARETETTIQRRDRAMPSSQFLRRALNVDITAEGTPLRRKGYTQHTAGYAHSLWSTDRLGLVCWVRDGQLFVGRSVDAAVPVADVNRYLPVSYTHINDSVYYSNGQELGEIGYGGNYKNWGTPVPTTPTTVGVGAGADGGYAFVGDRQVAATYVDYYGRESGASEPVLVSGGFIVSLPTPHPAGVAGARIYVSSPGSEILYYTAPFSSAPVSIDKEGAGAELETLNLHPPKAGQLVAHFNGRAYIARNDYVSFTEPLRYDLMRPSQGIYTFPDNVTLLEPSTDGIYVGTSKGVVFIRGMDPYDIQQLHVSPYAPVSGAVARVPGEKFGVPVAEVPVWWGKDGVLVVGLPGGQLQQLTRDRLAVPEYAAGAVSLREQDGMSHIVSSLRQGGMLNPLGATDSVVAEVRRNCIVLNT